MRAIKPDAELTLADRLSALEYNTACKMLGPGGDRMLSRPWPAPEDIEMTDARLRVTLADAVVTVRLDRRCRYNIGFRCDRCESPCDHVAATLSAILEEKMALGLAAPPEPAAAHTGAAELVARAIEQRAERARVEPMRLRSADPKKPWTDYTLTSRASGRTYRVALRGFERGESYCSCPDFRKNTLGTCKHILHALAKVKRRFPKARLRRRPYRRGVSVHLRYGESIELRVARPTRVSAEARKILEPVLGQPVSDARDLVRRIEQLQEAGLPVTVYPDAEELIHRRLLAERFETIASEIATAPADHPLRRELLAVELRPYQLAGIGFALGAGRSIVADEMGLGKTIQAIGVAEVLAREAGIARVLVVSPASVKAQWQAEITRFCGRASQLVAGPAATRPQQYGAEFFTICNYEQVLRDIAYIEQVEWDLIVLDEAQRIKNWEAKTSRMVKRLRSPFALALTGTPIENRLDDLFSIMEFVDERRLGPAFRFFERHRELDQDGKMVGYRNLDELRAKLAPVVLRRTRAEVLSELPERTTQIVRIAPTAEQKALHDSHMRVAGQIASKKYISEMDLLRLRRALLMCRLAANGTFLVDKEDPGASSKLEELERLLGDVLETPDRKALIFSEWTSMLDRLEPLLAAAGVEYVRLDGSVPQLKRRALVKRFFKEPRCRVFLTTNAGATGLNLQAADVVINVDLPWNPAVLEQRIARAHRMGQARPVQVFALVTDDTIEANMLKTLSAKHDLALAALSPDATADRVGIASSLEELKGKLEVLLGARPEAPVETFDQARTSDATGRLVQRRAQAAGGALIGAVFELLGQVAPDPEVDAQVIDDVGSRIARGLEACLAVDDEGTRKLTVELPPAVAISDVARSLARFMAAAAPAS